MKSALMFPKKARLLWFAACLWQVLWSGCACLEERRPDPPGSLGAIPGDLPLPPGFFLYGKERSWLEGEGDGASAHLVLEGSFPAGAVLDYYRGHMLLARWKPAEAQDGELAFVKAGRTARVRVSREGEVTLLVIDLGVRKEEKPADGRKTS